MLTPVHNTLVGMDSSAVAHATAPDPVGSARLMEACEQFEALLVNQLLKEMRAGLPEGGVIPRGRGERLFQEMLDTEYALQLSQTHAMGIGDLLYRQLQPDTGAPRIVNQAG